MPEKPAPWNGDRASTCTKDTMFNIYRLKYKQQSSYSLIVFYLSLDFNSCFLVKTKIQGGGDDQTFVNLKLQSVKRLVGVVFMLELVVVTFSVQKIF